MEGVAAHVSYPAMQASRNKLHPAKVLMVMPREARDPLGTLFDRFELLRRELLNTDFLPADGIP